MLLAEEVGLQWGQGGPGYDKDDVAGRGIGDSRKGVRSKTVTTEKGPVEVAVPHDTAGPSSRSWSASGSGG
jgi:hypothetical protein